MDVFEYESTAAVKIKDIADLIGDLSTQVADALDHFDDTIDRAPEIRARYEGSLLTLNTLSDALVKDVLLAAIRIRSGRVAQSPKPETDQAPGLYL